MATWANRSFDLVGQGGYLDKLAAIYPVAPPMARPLSDSQRNIVQAALVQSDDERLLKALLDLKGHPFPFNDSYVSFVRKERSMIPDNPQTVRRICKRLRRMGATKVLKALEKPAEANRQMGSHFRRWLRKTYPSVQSEAAFKVSKRALVFLDVSESRLRAFANTELGAGLEKLPDFVCKVKTRYVIGEAKFMGTEGGHQNTSFKDAMELVNKSLQRAVTLAVLDGIMWIPDSGQMSKRLANCGGNALTALLLDDFLRSL